MFGLSSLTTYAILAAVVVIGTGAVIGYVYHKGSVSGSNAVITKIDAATIKTTNDAVKAKENADEKARTDPPDAVIDRTR